MEKRVFIVGPEIITQGVQNVLGGMGTKLHSVEVIETAAEFPNRVSDVLILAEADSRELRHRLVTPAPPATFRRTERASRPNKILITTASAAEGCIGVAALHGFRVCIDMHDSPQTLYQAVRIAAAGGSYVSPSLSLAEDAFWIVYPSGEGTSAYDAYEVQCRPKVERAQPSYAAAVEVLRKCLLTSRQAEVGGLAAEGFSNEEIADRLFLCVPTVKRHLFEFFLKLDLCRRSQIQAKVWFL